MNELEKNILTALVKLEEAVKTMPTSRSRLNLVPFFARLDDLASRLPRDADPNLVHYLQKKSYEKARLLLEGRDAEHARGSCRQG